MNIDFTLEDAKYIDEILMELKTNNQFVLDPQSSDVDTFARYITYANYIADCGYVKTPHIQPYCISLYGLKNEGLDFINRGGLTPVVTKKSQDIILNTEIKRLTIENLELQNSESRYKEKIRTQESIIRWWQVATAIFGFISILLALLAFFL